MILGITFKSVAVHLYKIKRKLSPTYINILTNVTKKRRKIDIYMTKQKFSQLFIKNIGSNIPHKKTPRKNY